MECKLKPLGDRVVVKKEPVEEKTKSGILLPASAVEEKLQEGTVVAVGSGYMNSTGIVPMEVSVGDKALYSKFQEIEVTVDNEKYIIIDESDILAVIKK